MKVNSETCFSVAVQKIYIQEGGFLLQNVPFKQLFTKQSELFARLHKLQYLNVNLYFTILFDIKIQAMLVIQIGVYIL